MTPELKTKWVAALKSGKYAQTNGALRDDKGYCCLGVLLAEAGYKFSDIEDPVHTLIEGYVPHPEGDYLPVNVGVELGVAQLWQEYYAGMNDDGCTFQDIAEDIENNKRLTAE